MKYGKQFWIDSLGRGWAMHLKETLKTPYASKLMEFIDTQYAMTTVFPHREAIFSPFKLCPWENLKVVILGDAPITMGSPNGLAYGNDSSSIFFGPEVQKIYDCISREYYPDNLYLDFDFSLQDWAKQGVLLLNTSLTKTYDKVHTKQWNKFVNAVLNCINDYAPGTIFMLWGPYRSIKDSIGKNNYVLEYEGFDDYIGTRKDWHCPNFKEADKILLNLNNEIIRW
jgi:uracil-DNA glycosylase